MSDENQVIFMKIERKSIYFDGPPHFASNMQTYAFNYGTLQQDPSMKSGRVVCCVQIQQCGALANDLPLVRDDLMHGHNRPQDRAFLGLT